MARKILVVDPSQSLRKIVRSLILANIGDAEVVEAENDIAAAQLLKKLEPNILLFTWESSEDGWGTFFAEVQKAADGKKLFAILMTMRDSPTTMDKLRSHPVDGELTIPCSGDELVEIVNRICNPVRLRTAARYSLPETTALVAQGGNVFQAEVINLSAGGLLCDIFSPAAYGWQNPAIIAADFLVDGKKFSVSNIESSAVRMTVLHFGTDNIPEKVRVAFKFNAVPPADRDNLTGVIASLERNCTEFQEDSAHR